MAEIGLELPAPEKVLVVEDNPTQAELARMLVTGLGHDVRVVGTAREALEQARGWRPAAMLATGPSRFSLAAAASRTAWTDRPIRCLCQPTKGAPSYSISNAQFRVIPGRCPAVSAGRAGGRPRPSPDGREAGRGRGGWLRCRRRW